ncbi:MAG: hypothetical protein K2K60_05005 [Clostridia bacterium]|nr:hypothetical protein [Clostridia bacterium]
METLITITMDEREYELYQIQKRLAADAHRDKDELQEKYEALAEMVIAAIKEDKDGFPRTTTRKNAVQLLEKAREILR